MDSRSGDVAVIRPARRLAGTVALPPDKSIAHRAALFASLAEGISRIENYSAAADPQSTLACLRALGVTIEERDGVLFVHGRGRTGYHAPDGPLDCGNSGTTLRLMAGILAGQAFDTTLTGDASLRSRPMGRIAAPLAAMGADLALTDGRPPMTVRGGCAMKGITYVLPVASAQVKSCVLLAGLFADGETTVVEIEPSRDHTERMLGLSASEADGRRMIMVSPETKVSPATYLIPNDFSAAAFFLVAGSIVPEGELFLPATGLNPTRSALLHVLREMGADITVENERIEGGEPVADLTVRPARLAGIEVGGALIPNLIDEIPILAVAATQAEGRTVIRDAAELRVKETDRLAAVAANLRALGARIEERDDGLVIDGPTPLRGAEVPSFHDHRIAMSMAVAGLVATGNTTVGDASSAAVSFPGFRDVLEGLRSD
jgi:3-phosphoshikimate 1-carboxyvinyltransferase